MVNAANDNWFDELAVNGHLEQPNWRGILPNVHWIVKLLGEECKRLDECPDRPRRNNEEIQIFFSCIIIHDSVSFKSKN